MNMGFVENRTRFICLKFGGIYFYWEILVQLQAIISISWEAIFKILHKAFEMIIENNYKSTSIFVPYDIIKEQKLYAR